MRASDHSKALDGTGPRSQFFRREADSYDFISSRKSSDLRTSVHFFCSSFSHAHGLVGTTSTDYRSDRRQQSTLYHFERVYFLRLRILRRGPTGSFVYVSEFFKNKTKNPKTFLFTRTGWQPMGRLVRVWRVAVAISARRGAHVWTSRRIGKKSMRLSTRSRICSPGSRSERTEYPRIKKTEPKQRMPAQ